MVIFNNNVDIIFLILSSQDEYYDQFVKNFWLPFIKVCEEKGMNIKFIFMYGENRNIDKLIPSEYLLQTNIKEERIPGCLNKTIEGYKYVLKNYNFNYIYRCNLSGFIILDIFMDFYNTIKNNDYYIGQPVINHGCMDYIDEFMSGAGFFTSKNYSQFLLDSISKEENLIPFKENFKPLRYLPDDVAVGIILKNKNKFIKKRFDVSSNKMWQSGNETIFVDNLLTEENIKYMIDICYKKNLFHIRFKTENRNNDAQNMRILFQYYYKKNNICKSPSSMITSFQSSFKIQGILITLIFFFNVLKIKEWKACMMQKKTKRMIEDSQIYLGYYPEG